MRYFFQFCTAYWKQGIVHRDVRISNIMKHQSTIYLVDWGYAIESNTLVPFKGAIHVASTRVLQVIFKFLDEKQQLLSKEMVSFLPEDDLETLVKTRWLFLFPEKRKYLLSFYYEQIREILAFWENELAASEPLKDMITKAKNRNYQGIFL